MIDQNYFNYPSGVRTIWANLVTRLIAGMPTIITYLPRSPDPLEELGHDDRQHDRLLQDRLRVVQAGHVVPLDARIPLQDFLFETFDQMRFETGRQEHLLFGAHQRRIVVLGRTLGGRVLFDRRRLLVVVRLLRRRFLWFVFELELYLLFTIKKHFTSLYVELSLG